MQLTWSILFCFIILLVLSVRSHGQELVLATGSETGTYFAVGQEIKRAIENEYPYISVRVIPTNGSIENLELLQSGDADLAIAQHDIVSDYFTFKRKYPDFRGKVAGIASLFTEQVHIIVASQFQIKSIEQLAGRRVSIGPEGSGTYYNSISILKTLELYQHIHPVPYSFEKTIESLQEGKIDAALITAGAPMPMIRQLFERGQFELIPLRSTNLKTIRREYPDFLSVGIPSKTYPNQPVSTPTLGISALLLCRRDLTSDLIQNITKSLEQYQIDSENPLANLFNINIERAKKSIHLHNGAEKYLQTLSLFAFLKGTKQYFLFFLVLVLVILLFILSEIKSRWQNIPYIRLYRTILLLVGFWIFGTFFMHFFERPVNENFLTFQDSFWSIATYLFSGFEDKFPVTPAGKAVSVFLMIGGIGLIAFFTAEFASILTHKRIERRPKMEEYTGHILICNWNARGEKIIEEIHDPVALPNVPLIVISEEKIDGEQFKGRDEFKLVHFISGDLLNSKFLSLLGAHRTKSIIILADEKAEDPDAKSALIALTISSICREEHVEEKKKPRIVAEVLNHRKIQHLKNAGVNETVCSADYGIGILAQSAIYEKLSEVYDHLLIYSDDTNEIYALSSDNIPDKIWDEVFEGKTFLQVSRYFSEVHRDVNNPAILIGVRRGTRVILNPREDESYEWRKFDFFQRSKDDHPIFLSYGKPDLRKIKV